MRYDIVLISIVIINIANSSDLTYRVAQKLAQFLYALT